MTANTIRADHHRIALGETVSVQFDAVDNKGRRFGARARIDVVEYTLKAEGDDGWCYRIPEGDLGVWFAVSRHATRSGNDYGAYPGGERFRTASEAEAYIAQYFADAEKRALKNKARAA